MHISIAQNLANFNSITMKIFILKRPVVTSRAPENMVVITFGQTRVLVRFEDVSRDCPCSTVRDTFDHTIRAILRDELPTHCVSFNNND